MQITKNLGLQIPEQDDIYDVDYVGYNMEIIDRLMDLDNIEKTFNRIFFWHVPYLEAIEEAFRTVYIHVPEYITQDTGLAWEDYGTEIMAEEIRDMICAGWDGEDVSYYDNCADAAEEQYRIVFGGFGDFPDTSDSGTMTADDILEAINTPWNGQTSPDPAALSAGEITKAINTPWNGQTSSDSTALNADEITETIKNAVI